MGEIAGHAPLLLTLLMGNNNNNEQAKAQAQAIPGTVVVPQKVVEVIAQGLKHAFRHRLAQNR